MEREICFDGNGIITLSKGVVIAIEGGKFKIHSSDRKEVTYFDNEGKFIDKHPTIVESQGYTDFGCLKYFEKMGKKERKTVKHWLNLQKPKNEHEKAFLTLVNEATKEVQYGYHIAIQEAMFDGQRICFKENSKSWFELSEEEWDEKAKEFAPQYKSKSASLYELYYWYAYKIAKGDLTFDDICNAPYLRYKIIVLREI